MTDDPSFAAALGRALFRRETSLPPALLGRIAATYDETLEICGPSPQAVLWRSHRSQHVRFRILLKVLGRDRWRRGLTINDLGCGYGALFRHVAGKRFLRGGRYIGYDLCPAMIAAARNGIADPRVSLHVATEPLEDADYSFASGTFGLKLDTPREAWAAIIRDTLRQMAARSRRGLAFNLLDVRTADQKSDLYYTEPEEWVPFARAELGARVQVVRRRLDRDFSLLVRRD